MDDIKLEIIEIIITPSKDCFFVSFRGEMKTPHWSAKTDVRPLIYNDLGQALQVVKNLLERGSIA
jgi:hypothetical protein